MASEKCGCVIRIIKDCRCPLKHTAEFEKRLLSMLNEVKFYLPETSATDIKSRVWALLLEAERRQG
jgi:hypothetical protein